MPKQLTISIAMCTYNGERFLQEQLDSFLRQTRLPDELVVCDDGSRDRTGDILEAFAQKAPFTVRIYKNPQNLGWRKNFEKASCLCQGDIIVFSDQDDVWLPPRLGKIEQVFKDHPKIGFLFDNAAVTDEHLNPLGYSVWEATGFTSSMQEKICGGDAIKILFKGLEIYGITLAFRGDLRYYIYPFPDLWAHDDWIPLVLSMLSECIVVPEQLSLYRQHASQYTGVRLLSKLGLVKLSKSIPRTYYKDMAKHWSMALPCLQADEILSKDLLPLVENKINYLNYRGDLPQSLCLRIPYVIKGILTGGYFIFSRDWKSIAKDLILG